MEGMQWFKLRADMFDDEKIKIIQSMPEGDVLLVVWIRLIALAGKCNANGLLLVEDEFPYTDEMLAVIFNKPLQTVKFALATFERFRMLESTTEGIYITNFEKYQDIEDMNREQNRIRKQRERERKKVMFLEESSLIAQVSESEMDENKNVTGMSRDKSVTGHDYVTGMSRDKSVTSHDYVTDEEKEKAKEKERSKEKEREREKGDVSSGEDTSTGSRSEPDLESSKKIVYRQIMEDYNQTCTDLPPISAMTDERRKQIRTLINGMDRDQILPDKSVYERLHSIFQNAQGSDFLSGRDGRWTGCAFDWLIKKTNALKVLEGTYANKPGRAHLAEKKQTNCFCDFPQRNYDCGKIEEQLLSGGRTALP